MKMPMQQSNLPLGFATYTVSMWAAQERSLEIETLN